MPNGINTSTRTPTDFYKSQLKFIEKKEDNLNQIYKNIMEDENKNKNVSLASKSSVKIASAKNPNESREDFCKRLYREKLKTVKENIEKPKEEKKLTKEQVNSLSDKLIASSISTFSKTELNDFICLIFSVFSIIYSLVAIFFSVL